MTATTGSAEVLALADKYARKATFLIDALIDDVDRKQAEEYRTIEYALRLAAKPAEEVRETPIEEVSKRLVQMADNMGGMHAPELKRLARALSTPGQPKQ